MMSSTAYLLYKAGILAQQAVHAALAAAELTYREFLVLAFASANELSQQDVARRLSTDPTLIVSTVDALEERGLVARTRDPRDRRRNVLVITDAGHAALAQAADAAGAVEREFLAALGATKSKQLNHLLIEALSPHLDWLSA